MPAEILSACPVRIQCKACPWRVDVVPDRDIPNGYSAKRHRALKNTIAEPGAFHGGSELRTMACHESKAKKEIVCVGWLANQLGPGNNLALRMKALSGALPKFQLVGEQHETFEDTLP